MLTPNIKYSCLKASYLFFNTTKTEGSERYIALPEETMEMLRAYRKWYIKTSTEFGSRWHNTGFPVLSGEVGLRGNAYESRFGEYLAEVIFQKA